jgi:hypothetical protein
MSVPFTTNRFKECDYFTRIYAQNRTGIRKLNPSNMSLRSKTPYIRENGRDLNTL